MGRAKNALLGSLTILLLLGVVVWTNLTAIMLFGIEWAANRRTPVGPHQVMEWSKGPDPMGRAPEDRPPNIVLILADDLGWNDLTFQGGGVAGGTVPTPRIDSIAADGVS